MALPTAEEVTNMYLYGAKTRPVDLLDPGLLSHSASTTRNFIEVSEAEYIAGPGRFVSAANFKVIEDFFNDTSLAPNTYSKQDIFCILVMSMPMG